MRIRFSSYLATALLAAFATAIAADEYGVVAGDLPVVAEEPAERSEPASGLTLDDVERILEPTSPREEEAVEPQAVAPSTWAETPAPAVTIDNVATRIERIAREAPERIPVFVEGALSDLQAGRVTQRAQIGAGIAIALGLLLITLLVRLARGRGDIVVVLEYPSELSGTFSVRLAGQSAGTARGCKLKSPEEAERLGASSHTEHHGVSRETSFRGIATGPTYVSVEGFVQNASGDVLATHFVEREARVVRGGIARVDFDLSPRACPVEVRVVWERKPVEGALVARRGAPGSMRFAKSRVHYSLDRGTHVLVAGNADRVAEVPVEVESFQPRRVTIDLANREQLIFTGCPLAVEPYLHGDVAAAARALEKDGQSEASHRMLGAFHLENDRLDTAAEHFLKAGRVDRAAELRESLHQFEQAAVLFERCGEDERAAENYRSAGQLVQAGDAYSRADSYDSAVDCFEKAGDVGRWIDALEKKGDPWEAARVALDQGDRRRGIQCLNQVPTGDAHYPEAVIRLAEAYHTEGHGDIAVRKLEELLASQRMVELGNDGMDQAATLLEKGGAIGRALEVLEQIRDRDATHPNLATRIEALRKARSGSGAVSGAMSASTQVFSNDFRYEILEEIGRGGMGVVFRARDTRLGREVALKRLPENLRNHPKAVELFLREARAAAALNHPNIVTLFDADQEDDTYYLTMELLVGSPLQNILHERGRLSAAHVVKLGGQVTTGLEFAHEQGVVHRDIKTANLFFTNKRIVKIMDFGLAKMVEEVRRAATVIGGTPYYMAPEQSAGEATDHRADLYALGVTFYELLAGTVPFKDGDVAFHHRHTVPPDVRTLAPDTPPAMAELIADLLQKEPDARIESATTVKARLAAIARAL
jgi:tRNA A-37 threonylcarbamoyl transferase component Bud32